MTSLVNETLLAMSRSLPASILVKATVAAALGLLGARLARKSRAAVRHAVLAATFGVLLLLPVAALVAPPFRIVVPAEAQQRSVPMAAGFAKTISPIAPTQTSLSNGPALPRVSISALLLAAWIGGAMLFLMPVAASLWQIRSLRRSALAWRRGQPSADALALEAGIQRRVDVLLHEALPGPMTCGIVRPAILLPRDAETWPEQDVNRAILHELEHVRRGDWVSQCLARCLCAAYWFHPLVWMAWRRLELEAERSCDDAVLRQSEATAYADQLVGLAERLSAGQRSLLAMANRSDLAARVSAVLDGKHRVAVRGGCRSRSLVPPRLYSC